MIITDRYKEHDMDKSARELIEDEIADWGDQVDPADLFTVIRILQDNDDSLTLESQLIQDLIDATQSNGEKTRYALKEMIRLDEQLINLED